MGFNSGFKGLKEGEVELEDIDWIHQIYERDKRRVVVNAVMKN